MLRNFFSYFIPFFYYIFFFSSYIYFFFVSMFGNVFSYFVLFLFFSFHFFFFFFFFLYLSPRGDTVFAGVCCSVCLWTTLPNQTETADHIFMKILPRMYIGIRKSFITIWKSSVERQTLPYVPCCQAEIPALYWVALWFFSVSMLGNFFSNFFHFYFISYKYWVN